jgi:hypothetical protein
MSSSPPSQIIPKESLRFLRFFASQHTVAVAVQRLEGRCDIDILPHALSKRRLKVRQLDPCHASLRHLHSVRQVAHLLQLRNRQVCTAVDVQPGPTPPRRSLSAAAAIECRKIIGQRRARGGSAPIEHLARIHALPDRGRRQREGSVVLGSRVVDSHVVVDKPPRKLRVAHVLWQMVIRRRPEVLMRLAVCCCPGPASSRQQLLGRHRRRRIWEQLLLPSARHSRHAGCSGRERPGREHPRAHAGRRDRRGGRRRLAGCRWRRVFSPPFNHTCLARSAYPEYGSSSDSSDWALACMLRSLPSTHDTDENRLKEMGTQIWRSVG